MQRDTSFPIWKQYEFSVSFMGKTYNAIKTGSKWLVELDLVQAGGPFILDIITKEKTERIQDIYVGDVWLCAGQSNMEMPMERIIDYYPDEWEAGEAEFPLIRQFKVPQNWDFNTPREELEGGNWIAACDQTLHEFSAAAWFFAKNMYKKYGIPIGLVNTAWGGTPIESWMSKESLISFPEKIKEAQVYSDSLYCKKIAEKNISEILEWDENLKNKDTGLKENWQMPQTDISHWNDIILPGDFSDAGLENFNGVIWLARDFEINSEIKDNEIKIWLGTITDADTVFINGKEIGNTTYRYPPRKYSVNNQLLNKGINRIVIRVVCNNGQGAVTKEKPFYIFSKSIKIELEGSWKFKTGAFTSVRPNDFFFQWQPIGPYNAMIAPVLKFPLKGVIWYQGESNEKNPDEYKQLFITLIQDWRFKNSNQNLPFIFVQLPLYGKPSETSLKTSWAILRQAQAEALSLEQTGMAIALDLGEWNDIHPVNKKDVGFRLFLAADKILYNEGPVEIPSVYKTNIGG